MKKRGAIHVDWVISIGIFLIYLTILLVLIKPGYKAVYEKDVLTKMVKDEFLMQNNVNAGFTIITVDKCNKGNSNIEEELNKKLPEGVNIYDEVYIEFIGPYYKAYFFNIPPNNFLGKFMEYESDINSCKDIEVGEIFYYNGLRENLDFDKNKFVGFPEKSEYKITIYGGSNDGRSFGSDREPLEDAYVLDMSASNLKWENNEVKRESIIINIKVW